MAKQLTTPEKNIGAHRYHPSLRSLLIVLVTSTVVPIFLFSVWLIVLQSQREMEAIEEQLVDTAQAIAIDVDREVASTIQSLQILALDFDLDTARTTEFQELSNRMLSARQAWKTVIVRDPSGRPLVTVPRQTHQAQSTNSDSDESLDLFKTEKGGAKHSPLAFLLGSSVTVHVPITFEQKIKYFASVLLDPKVFAGLLSQHKISPEWLVSIIDSKKTTVASTRFADRLFGKPTQLLLPSSGHSAPGQLFRSKIEDVPSYVVFSTAPVSQWSVALAVPAEVVEAPYHRMLWLIVGVGLLCLFAGITIAYVIGRKVTRPLERLAAAAKDRVQGKPVDNSPNGSLSEVETINEALDQSADLLKEREQERDYFSEELDVRLHDLTGLHKLTTSLLAIDDRQVLFNEIVAGALILLKADKGSLHLTNQKTQGFDLVAQIGFPNELDECFDSLARSVLNRRRAAVIEDIEQDSNFNDLKREAASEAAVRAAVSFPLTAPPGDIRGVLSSYFLQPFKPSQWQVILMDLYAQYCVNLIDQIRGKEELRAHNNGLEDQMKDNTKKLEEAYLQRINDLTRQRELEKGLREAQKMEIVGTLAGGVAHDFNNILNIILSYASTLNTNDERESRKNVQIIEQMVKRGASVVNQLLAVARKTAPKFETTDLNGLIQGLTDLLKQTFPKNIIIVTQLDPQVRPVMLDSNQISQAVINLCVNARDAMPNGGRLTIVTQYLDAPTARQRFAGAKDIPYGCITVSDTGTGIQNEAKEHIFEPFFTTKGPNHGTGLGLSVAYGIMQTHDGFIHFDSQPGRGTSFYLCFPIREATGLVALEKKSAEITSGPSLQGATILIVEDEPNQIALLRRVFEREGYKILTAADGDMALEVFSNNRHVISAVLLDFGLPGTNGWEVFQKMREIDPNVKVVFATGYVLRDVSMEMIEKDSYGVLMKPYVVREALTKLATTIKGHKSPKSNPLAKHSRTC